MADLYNEILDPAAITRYAQLKFAEMDAKQGSLAGFLPNVKTPSHTVDVNVESTRLATPAQWRSFDAEPEFGHGAPSQSRTFKLQPISQQEPVGELQQLLDSEDTTRQEASAARAAFRVVQAVAERVEMTRANVLATGRFTVADRNVKIDESFGRAPEMQVTASTPWAAGVDVLSDLMKYIDAYSVLNGVEPGTLLISSKIYTALSHNAQFNVKMADGTERPATRQGISEVLSSQTGATVEFYDRRNALGRLIPEDTMLLLPARGESTAATATDLGATFWSESATARFLGLDSEDSMGIVCGLRRNAAPPVGLEVFSDALVLPALVNANLSMAVKVL